MKVLYLTPGCFDKGGVSRYSRYQISALRDEFGVSNVKVLSLFSPDEHAIEEKFDVEWSGDGAGAVSKLRFVAKAVSIALKWKPNVIHSAHMNFSGVSHFISRRIGAKSLLNIYGREVWSPLSFDAKYGFGKSDRIISDCHFTADYVVDNGIRKSEDIDIIWDCINVDLFKKIQADSEALAKYGLIENENHFVIGTLGRLSYTAAHKGYDRLIDVVSRLYKAGQTNIRLVIAGRGDMKEFLEKMAVEKGISEITTFTGSVHEDDMPQIYSFFDVFSLVSDRGAGRGEGIPLTPLEAMGCVVPIIVGNQDGSQEAVVDERNGYVIDPFDIDAHANCILELLGNQELLQSKTEEAGRVALEVFSYDSFKQKTKESYITLNEQGE